MDKDKRINGTGRNQNRMTRSMSFWLLNWLTGHRTEIEGNLTYADVLPKAQADFDKAFPNVKKIITEPMLRGMNRDLLADKPILYKRAYAGSTSSQHRDLVLSRINQQDEQIREVHSVVAELRSRLSKIEDELGIKGD